MRRRIGLTQLLASIAILAFPLAIYAPALRAHPDRSTFLTIALIVHSIELEAFLWLLLAPAVRSCLGRWRGTPVSRPDGPTARVRDRVLLAIGPCLAVLSPGLGWWAGYRLPGGRECEGFLFLMVTCAGPVLILIGIVLTIVSLFRRPREFPRSAMAVALLVLVVPCIGSFDLMFHAGLIRLEREIGPARLARNCIDVLQSRATRGTSEWLSADEVDSAVIRRLRPRRVEVSPGRLRIELHGGFEHYGYELVKDRSNPRWVFHWYHAEGRDSRLLMTWPVGSDP